MPVALFFPLALLLGYFMGSLPFGFLLVKWATGEDLRKIESGRTGTTNTYRAAGRNIGIMTAFCDVFKGSVAVWLTRAVFASRVEPTLLPWLIACAGIGAVIGHNWSIFLGFKGGAGTTPNIGWALTVWWPVMPIAFLVCGAIFWGIGMASVVSLAMAAVLVVVFGIRYFANIDPTAAYLIGSLITCALIVWSLRPNVRRLLNGNERVVGPRARRQAKRAGAGD